MSEPLIEVRGLRKEYRQGFWRRRVHAVRGIDFGVSRGAAFGFLGPNGAGKTSTIKVLMGLTRATQGEVRLFGQCVPAPQSRSRVGYMPENPYIYPYLTPREFVRLSARLSGLRGADLRRRSETVLERTGVAYAGDRPARKLSKGMLQRTGLAAALVAEPELLVLDEPMSGLDPGGQRDVRDLLIEERRSGRTLLVCTHILSDVPTLCDRVVILQQGRVVVSGALDDLLQREAQCIELTLAGSNDGLVALRRFVAARAAESPSDAVQSTGPAKVAPSFRQIGQDAGRARATLRTQAELQAALRVALDHAVSVERVTPRFESLEELFVRKALAAPREAAARLSDRDGAD